MGHIIRSVRIPVQIIGAMSMFCFAGVLHAQNILEEVIVTAQKRAESIQDVPLSISALTGEDIESLGIQRADDILKAFPNLSFNGQNGVNSGFTIRGVGTNNFHGNVARAVGVYQDEVSMGSPYVGVLGVFDMARIEVVRGPQNTLFGRNTTGGAINYVSVLPSPGEGVNGYVRGTYGSYNQADVEGAVGFDLGTGLAGRVSLQTVNRDGLFNNLATGDDGFGDRERHSGRVQLLWQPSAATQVLFNYHVGLNRGEELGNKANGIVDPASVGAGAQSGMCAEIGRAGDFESANSCVNRRGENTSSGNWEDIYNPTSATQDVDINGAFIKVQHDLGWATVTSITAYEETELQLTDDNGGASTLEFMPVQDSEFEQLTQELRLASPGEGELRWIAGFYYYQEDMLQSTNVRRFNGGDVTAFNILDQTDEDFSYYGQVEYDVREDVTMTVGLRYTDNSREASSRFGVGLSGAAGLPVNQFTGLSAVRQLTATAGETCPPGPPGVDANGRAFGGPPPCLLPLLRPTQELNELGGKVGVDYRPTEQLMVFGSYSRGFKTGGFDTRALAAFNGDAGVPVEPEFLNAYEVGFKSEMLEGALQLNGSGFFYSWQGLQTFAVTGGIPGFLNIPRSELYGAEVEAKWVPGPGWFVQAGLGFLETEITDSGNLQGGIDVGHELPNSPGVTFNGLLSKTLALGAGELTLQADVRYVGEMVDTLEFAEDFVSTKGEQFYVNLRATYRFGESDRYEVSFWGENLTSEKTCLDIGPLDNVLAPTNFFGGGAGLTFNVSCSPNDGTALFGGTAKINF